MQMRTRPAPGWRFGDVDPLASVPTYTVRELKGRYVVHQHGGFMPGPVRDFASYREAKSYALTMFRDALAKVSA